MLFQFRCLQSGLFPLQNVIPFAFFILLTSCGGDSSAPEPMDESSSKSSGASDSVELIEKPVTIEEGQPGLCEIDGSIKSEYFGYKGGGYIDSDEGQGAKIGWMFESADPQKVSLEIRYANGTEAALKARLMSSFSEQEFVFPPTGTWNDWETYTLDDILIIDSSFNELHVLALANSGLPNIDSITIIGRGIKPRDCAVGIRVK